MKRKAVFTGYGVTNPLNMLPLVEILGDQRVLVERHKGVMGYDGHKICIKLSFGMIYVNGCNLEITHMSKDQMIITGKIHDVVLKRSNS